VNQQLLAVLDGSDAVVARFEYAGGRMPVAMVQGEDVYYLAYDQVGSLRAVYTAAGDVVRTVEYDAWGVILDEDIAQGYEGLKVPFGFAGGLHDRDTGLVLFGLRNYDPETGRWTSRDPIGLAGGDTDLYACCGNDPVGKVDPSGLSDINLPVSPWGPGGAYFPTLPRMEFSFPDLLAWHYDRNAGLPPPPATLAEAVQLGWSLRDDAQAVCHQFAGEANVVAEGPGGREAVYNRITETLVTTPENAGSYNYVAPSGLLGKAGHGCADVLPWILLGNSREDTTSILDRCQAFLSGITFNFNRRRMQENSSCVAL